MSDRDLVDHLNALPMPVCADLMPCAVLEATRTPPRLVLRFEPQPAFGNHFHNVAGGFAVAMLDGVLSLVTYVATGAFLPTISIDSSFLAPLPIGEVTAEGRIVRAGSSVVFAEADLRAPDGTLCVRATGTAAVRS